MVGGVRVVVPDSLELITPYVLLEQGDWFEDEIKFVRLMLQPGQHAIDIGANYGLYSLAMAASVGRSGRVWSFEPASSTAGWLARSVAENGFDHVVVDQRALSDLCGVANLTMNAHAELNAISHSCPDDVQTEQVAMVTLDSLLDEYGWSEVDFMKIDAEGEEAAIIRGGKRFFSRCSPLVQFEIKAGNEVSLDLVDAFAALDYHSYRLVPGLEVLVPFSVAEPVDGYQLNLFACRDDRAEILARKGLLLMRREVEQAVLRDDSLQPYHWIRRLKGLPYADMLMAGWQRHENVVGAPEVGRSLALHSMAHDTALPLATRVAALSRAYSILVDLCAQQPSHYRYSSLARVASEWGARRPSVDALGQFAMLFREYDPGEVFLPASVRFDHIDPGDRLNDWTLSFTLEEIERRSTFSSFYSGAAVHKRLELLCKLGFASPEMLTRKALVERRFFGVS